MKYVVCSFVLYELRFAQYKLVYMLMLSGNMRAN
jgi:hypothetical protein